MIEQQANVISADSSTAWLRLGGQSGCPACDAGEGCGAGVFGKLLNRRELNLRVKNTIGAVAGQAVLVGLTEAAFLRFVFHLYGIPLLAGLAGALISHQIMKLSGAGPVLRDLATLAAALIGGGLSLRYIKSSARRALTELPVTLLAARPGGTSCALASSVDGARRAND